MRYQDPSLGYTAWLAFKERQQKQGVERMLAHGFYMPKSFCDQCQLEHEEFGDYCQGCERLVTSNLVSV